MGLVHMYLPVRHVIEWKNRKRTIVSDSMAGNVVQSVRWQHDELRGDRVTDSNGPLYSWYIILYIGPKYRALVSYRSLQVRSFAPESITASLHN